MNRVILDGLARLCIVVWAAAGAMAWADPPSRVGRIGFVEGEASFYADREEGWTPARLNFPVTSENSLWTAGRSRAEVRIGASALRIGNDTILDFVAIGDEVIDTYLQRGTLNIRTRNYGGDDYRENIRVDTSEGRFIIDGNGRYRIDTDEDGMNSRIAVFAGRARYEGDGNTLNIDAGRALLVRAGTGATDLRFENASESAFDRWAEARDMRWDETHRRYAREQNVSPYMTGYEELDAYGEWVDDREYGRVWTPRVVEAGWTPYRYGSWAYVSPWGWTWVDDAPWGFAPFHYGRWVQIGARWCWWPGNYVRRPVYAPALVGWMGERPGVSVSVSVGPSVGWFPLAPREHYIPAYTSNITYIRRVNYITNNVTIVNPPARYINQAPGATFVNSRTFVSSRPIQANTIRINPAQVNAHPVLTAPEPPSGSTWINLRAKVLQQSQAAAPQTVPAATARPQPAAPSYTPQFAPPVAATGRPLQQGEQDGRRGRSWQNERQVPAAPAATVPVAPNIQAPPPVSTPPTAQGGQNHGNRPWQNLRPVPTAPAAAPVAAPVQTPAPVQAQQNSNANNSARPNTPPSNAAPNENSQGRGSRNFEQGERGQRGFGRGEPGNGRGPEPVRPAENIRPPVVSRPVESRPGRVEPAAPVAAPAPVQAPRAAAPAAAATPSTPPPRPLPRSKQEQLREADQR